MLKTFISLTTIIAISTGAMAARNTDLRESDTYTGKFQEHSTVERLGSTAKTPIVKSTNLKKHRDANAVDFNLREQHRIAEKNSGPMA
jgi:hypothetical protein